MTEVVEGRQEASNDHTGGSQSNADADDLDTSCRQQYGRRRQQRVALSPPRWKHLAATPPCVLSGPAPDRLRKERRSAVFRSFPRFCSSTFAQVRLALSKDINNRPERK
ncbi:hypothetical protein MRX96_056161 [Rhipicephalus microplus]